MKFVTVRADQLRIGCIFSWAGSNLQRLCLELIEVEDGWVNVFWIALNSSFDPRHVYSTHLLQFEIMKMVE